MYTSYLSEIFRLLQKLFRSDNPNAFYIFLEALEHGNYPYLADRLRAPLKPTRTNSSLLRRQQALHTPQSPTATSLGLHQEISSNIVRKSYCSSARESYSSSTSESYSSSTSETYSGSATTFQCPVAGITYSIAPLNNLAGRAVQHEDLSPPLGIPALSLTGGDIRPPSPPVPTQNHYATGLQLNINSYPVCPEPDRIQTGSTCPSQYPYTIAHTSHTHYNSSERIAVQETNGLRGSPETHAELTSPATSEEEDRTFVKRCHTPPTTRIEVECVQRSAPAPPDVVGDEDTRVVIPDIDEPDSCRTLSDKTETVPSKKRPSLLRKPAIRTDPRKSRLGLNGIKVDDNAQNCQDTVDNGRVTTHTPAEQTEFSETSSCVPTVNNTYTAVMRQKPRAAASAASTAAVVIKTVTLHKQEGHAFGFKFVSAKATERQRYEGDDDYYVTTLTDGTPAKRCGQIHVKDTILELNGQPIKNWPNEQVLDLLKGTNTVTLTLQVFNTHRPTSLYV